MQLDSSAPKVIAVIGDSDGASHSKVEVTSIEFEILFEIAIGGSFRWPVSVKRGEKVCRSSFGSDGFVIELKSWRA